MSKYNYSIKKSSVLAYKVEYLTKIRRIDGKKRKDYFVFVIGFVKLLLLGP